MLIETLLKTHAHARLHHLLFYVFKKTGNSRKKMCWIPRKDLMTYHPRCVEFQEKISWHNIPDVLKSKERYYTPPPPLTPHPPNQHHAKKKQQKKTEKEVSLRRNTKKRKKCALAVAPVQWTSKNTVSWRGLLRAPSQLHSTIVNKLNCKPVCKIYQILKFLVGVWKVNLNQIYLLKKRHGKRASLKWRDRQQFYQNVRKRKDCWSNGKPNKPPTLSG